MAARKRFTIRIVSTYPPRMCGVGKFSHNLATALRNFPHDIRSVKIAAIDKDGLSYSSPVDIVIDQYDPESWKWATRTILSTARRSRRRKVIILQHEYGLDPDPRGRDCRGRNFVHMARAFHEDGLMVLVYLHTVLADPDEHQRRVLQELARYSDLLIVTTDNAAEILTRPPYNLPAGKVKHIDHGIRSHHPSDADRLAMKKVFGLEDIFLATTLGLRSPDKGIQYSIPAYSRFVHESCTAEQRRHLVYLIGGQCHPEFMKAEKGRLYREYQALMDRTLKASDLRWCAVEHLRDADPAEHDIIFLDRFLDEQLLLRLYAATNVMVLPYLNMQQVSSGILADTVGSGRVAVATKFMYAVELLAPQRVGEKGLIVDRRARGILVDPGEESVEQMAQALDFLVFHPAHRLRMEHAARARGHAMRWNNTAWEVLRNIQFIFDERGLVEGRGHRFVREKPSVYADRNERLLARRRVRPVPAPKRRAMVTER